MNQIKPYLFWIVIGAILMAEIVWWVLSIPDIAMAGNKEDAQKAKATLDKEYTHLELLDKKAKLGSPSGTFDAENPNDIRRLTDDYLITPAWRDVLIPHVKRYDEQLSAIKEHLAARSTVLAKPIAESSDKFGWYTAYQNATEEQLKKLHAGKALLLPAGAAKPAFAVGGPGGAAPSVTTPDGTSGPDFAGDSALRATAGFFTKGSELPEPTQHPLLTHQFRTMERIIAVLLRTTATDRANPLAGTAAVPEPRRAAIAGVSWGAAPGLGGDASRIATGWQLSLTLQGPLSALLSAAAALDFPHETEAPLMVVTGVELARKASFAPGERKDAGGEDLTMRLTLVVLDFSGAPAVAPADAPAGGAVPGMPPVMMMPPGAPGSADYQRAMPPPPPPGARPPRQGSHAAAAGDEQ